jgi:hypothetical protein
MPPRRGGNLDAVRAVDTPSTAAGVSQRERNPYKYIEGVACNDYQNSNPAAIIQIKRTYTILENPTEWDVACIRATYPMNAIPLGVCPVAGGINRTPFTVTISTAGGNYATTVLWVPEYTDQTVPISYSPQDYSTKYYFYSTIASLLKCFNTALATSATAASIANAPFFTYDPATGYFSLFFPTSSFGGASVNSVSLNLAASQYFTNFASTTANGLTKFSIPVTTNYVSVNGVQCIQLIQEAPNVTAWDSIGAIQMTTDMNIIPEDTALATTSFVPSGSTTQSQLTDILVDSGTGTLLGGSRSGIVQYIPSGVPRWTNLTSTPFSGFNVFLTWSIKNGYSFPLILPPGTQATMKLVFRHRTVRGYDYY